MATANKTNGQTEEKITALYCRLSVDDDNKDEESNSITNQKQILSDYAKKNGFSNTMFFVDDGISGTTFQRPSFQRMEQMAENSEISTIIVKDLSRFGREQVEMGRLTQVVYPSLGVRFIAIQERVDTLTGEGVEMMPFHNIFNEWYAAQTSKKIRAVWQSKAEHGERIASIVPYGYKRSEETPRQWVIDEPAAETVRKIFALCLAGKGPMQIARQLEGEQILSPPPILNPSAGNMHRKSRKTLTDGNRLPSGISLRTGSTRAVPSISKALPSVTKSTRESSTARKITKSYPICRKLSSPRNNG